MHSSHVQYNIKIVETMAPVFFTDFMITDKPLATSLISIFFGCNVIGAKLFLDGCDCELQFVCKLKYLGVYLLSGKKLRL